MPLNITLGTLSSRAFGLMDGRVRTVTFTANGTWVCPGGVTNLLTVRGKGSDGISDNVADYETDVYCQAGTSGYANAPYEYWADLYTLAQTYQSALVVGSPGTVTVTLSHVGSDNTFDGPSPLTTLGVGNVVSVGAIGQYSPLNTAPTSGSVTYSQVLSGSLGFKVPFRATVTGHAGANSTAFGFTFAGGTYTAPTGNAATISTHANVAVTPGNSYPIVVPSGGFVSLTYYI